MIKIVGFFTLYLESRFKNNEGRMGTIYKEGTSRRESRAPENECE